MTDPIIADEDFRNALDRISRTPDGLVLYRFLQKELMGIPSSDKSGALRHHHGRRSLASAVMAMMAAGIESSAGTASNADRPVVFKLPEPRRVGPSRDARSFARRGPGGDDTGGE